MEPSMNIRSLIPKYLRPALVTVALTGAAMTAAPAVAQSYFSFGFGSGGFSFYSGNPYWAYHQRYHRLHRYLTFCEIYPQAYECVMRPRHHRHYWRYDDQMMGGYRGGY